VPELSHDIGDDGFHEIQLSGKQLVFLFIVVTFVSVVIFLCGVMVGRGARAVRGEEPAAIAADVPPAAPQAVSDAGPPAAEPPAPVPENDELSYHKRLQGEGAPAENLKPAPAGTGAPAPAEPAPEPKPAAPPAQAAADVPTTGRPGVWIVQVAALQDRGVATSLVQRLTGKGYPAFLVAPAGAGPRRLFKVQIGRYNDRREAEDVKRRLEKEEQFKPLISR
jgi:cell division septation protein DedD